MSEATREIKTEIKTKLESRLASLRELRGEIRVQIHLGALDAKKRWDAIEPRIEAALDRAARDVSETSYRIVDEAVELLKKFRDSLKPSGS